MQEAPNCLEYPFSGTIERIVRSKFGGPDMVVARLDEPIEGCEMASITAFNTQGTLALRQAGLLQIDSLVRGIGVCRGSMIVATRLYSPIP